MRVGAVCLRSCTRSSERDPSKLTKNIISEGAGRGDDVGIFAENQHDALGPVPSGCAGYKRQIREVGLDSRRNGRSMVTCIYRQLLHWGIEEPDSQLRRKGHQETVFWPCAGLIRNLWTRKLCQRTPGAFCTGTSRSPTGWSADTDCD